MRRFIFLFILFVITAICVRAQNSKAFNPPEDSVYYVKRSTLFSTLEENPRQLTLYRGSKVKLYTKGNTGLWIVLYNGQAGNIDATALSATVIERLDSSVLAELYSAHQEYKMTLAHFILLAEIKIGDVKSYLTEYLGWVPEPSGSKSSSVIETLSFSYGKQPGSRNAKAWFQIFKKANSCDDGPIIGYNYQFSDKEAFEQALAWFKKDSEDKGIACQCSKEGDVTRNEFIYSQRKVSLINTANGQFEYRFQFLTEK